MAGVPSSPLPRVAATYSFSVRLTPAPIGQGEQLRHAHLYLLVDETHNQVVGFEVTARPPTTLGVRDWLLAQFNYPTVAEVRRGRPKELLGDDPALMQALKFSLSPLGIKVRHASSLPALEQALAALAEATVGREPGISLVSLVGEEAALAFYRDADRFMASSPWEHFDNDELLCFDSGPYHRGVVIMGGFEQEFGLLLFPDVEVARAMAEGRFSTELISLSLEKDALMHPSDLELLLRHGLFQAGQRLPVLLNPSQHEQITPELLDELRWLLRAVPRLTTENSVEEKDRWLRREGSDPDDDALVIQLLERWNDDSPRAEQLAYFLVETLPHDRADLDLLAPIGAHFLASTQERPGQGSYFEASVDAAWARLNLSPELRSAFAETWELLSDPRQSNDFLEFVDLALPHVQSISVALAERRPTDGLIPAEQLADLRARLASNPAITDLLRGLFKDAAPSMRVVLDPARDELLRLLEAGAKG